MRESAFEAVCLLAMQNQNKPTSRGLFCCLLMFYRASVVIGVVVAVVVVVVVALVSTCWQAGDKRITTPNETFVAS